MKKLMFIFPIIILSLSFILAISTPEAFNGNIIIKDGKSADGKNLIGYVNGIATGSTKIEGTLFDIIVQDNIGSGGKVEFYIGNEKAKESFDFNSFEIIKDANLTFDTVSEGLGGVDDYCNIETECSINGIDCGINDCNTNGRCDIEIGENCANAPLDCGICPIATTTSSEVNSESGGSSGGGSSSGGGGSYFPPTSENSNENLSFEESGLKGATINDLNSKDSKKSKITGGVIGFAQTPTGIGLIIILMALFIWVGVMLIKRSPKNVR